MTTHQEQLMLTDNDYGINRELEEEGRIYHEQMTHGQEELTPDQIQRLKNALCAFSTDQLEQLVEDLESVKNPIASGIITVVKDLLNERPQ